MKMYFFQGGFYCDAIHDTIPDGALPLSDEQYQELLVGQEQGKCITTAEDGSPELIDPVPAKSAATVKAKLARIDSQKIRALTDFILTGDKTRLQELEDQAAALRAELTQIKE